MFWTKFRPKPIRPQFARCHIGQRRCTVFLTTFTVVTLITILLIGQLYYTSTKEFFFCGRKCYSYYWPPLNFLDNSTLELHADNLSFTDELSRTSVEFNDSYISTAKPLRRPADVSRYVGFSYEFGDGRGLGNQIFNLAAAVYVAELTGRQLALHINPDKSVPTIGEVFQLNMSHFDNLCPCYYINEAQHLAFHDDVENQVVDKKEALNKSIQVNGYRQSWRYTMAVEKRIRRHLVFRDSIQTFAEQFLRVGIPPPWNKAGFARVGIHVRRGDIILEKRFIDHGYTVPNASYFRKAMNYFLDRYRRVQFLAFSDDFVWTRKHVTLQNRSAQVVNIIYPKGHSSGQDLAILSLCDHVIMSTGTFGWWGAWLAKGTTIYYSNWPRKGSPMDKEHFKRSDFFPPNWIPMDD